MAELNDVNPKADRPLPTPNKRTTLDPIAVLSLYRLRGRGSVDRAVKFILLSRIDVQQNGQATVRQKLEGVGGQVVSLVCFCHE